MAVIKQLSQKLSDGSFSSPYDIGAEAVNVTISDGTSIEANLQKLNSSIADAKEQEQNDIKAVNTAIAKKADINHASTTTDYGVGTADKYGHLKISDTYDSEGNDPDNTAVSQTGIVELYNELLNKTLKVFYVLNEDSLLSVLNTGWNIEGESDKLYLLPMYYSIKSNGDGDYTLTATDGGNS